jgi:hypothetical protein
VFAGAEPVKAKMACSWGCRKDLWQDFFAIFLPRTHFLAVPRVFQAAE